ncbi:MAG: hypothetical protein KKE62_15870 [Proteobacteria bacterium]|nr:hypothetical protein [Pseudomonadota bacterium]MBU1387326.1 hypothetical protein [Pseudomonadota bacterium]MBU1544308.1 hypothetical protein [Pseudomonadota bacterium]MBU2431471.1 hypothetical protein [Pseudomonadota bacterium]MBU2480952.1 hypothetical protein [Pseudomonadota bacterium]
MLRTLIICSIIAMSSVWAHADLNLTAGHPDEDPEYTYHQRFSTPQSLDSLSQINSALDSFRQLTEISADKISKAQMEKIGHTGWEMQNLGFHNHGKTIQGTLLKQDYLIKKLMYELGRMKSTSGSADPKELSALLTEYQAAEKQFQAFWDSFLISD